MGLDVRRLAAVNMYGSKGGKARPWVVLAEFLFGAVVGTLFGVFVVVTATDPLWRLAGLVMVGIGGNYVPLTRHALALREPGAVAAELEGVDLKAELRALHQLWVCVPLAIVVFDRRQSEGARSL